MAFDFNFGDDGPSLEAAVFEALGFASVCWDNMNGTGVFHSDECKEAGDKLVQFIKDNEQPLLGLATTKQLLEEVVARLEVNRMTGAGNGYESEVIQHLRDAMYYLRPETVNYKVNYKTANPNG